MDPYNLNLATPPSGKILKGIDRKVFETEKIKLDVLKSEKIIGID